MSRPTFLIAIITLFISAHAESESYKTRSYVGGNIANLTYSETGTQDDVSWLSGYGRFGAQIEDYVSVEWRVGTGFQSEEVTLLDSPADVSLDMFYGAYLLGGIPISKSIYPYALIGYTRGELEVHGPELNVEAEESDISFGIGINIDISKDFSINAEYTRYLKENGIEISGPAAGFVYRFYL